MPYDIIGVSIIAAKDAPKSRSHFEARNPITGETLTPPFHSASLDDLDDACIAAADAAVIFGATSGVERAAFLRTIADGLSSEGAAIVDRAHLETGLPLARLQGELARTTGQLKLFAETIEEGSWVDARIDEALPERKPIPRADVRSMLRPLGPVAVFGASNFPLAFSVAGGDTASAFAAGNPVIVKAHPAHPGTSELVGRVIRESVNTCELPSGVFSLLFDGGIEIGSALVQHPTIKAVTFTGSSAGGQALMNLSAGRAEPIPCYAEMGSTNPFFIFPGALKERSAQLARDLQTSFTLGSGQFCTKPGLVFVPQQGSEAFVAAIMESTAALQPLGMLTHGIALKYGEGVQQLAFLGREPDSTGTSFADVSLGAKATPAVFAVTLTQFLNEPKFEEEVFGPATLLIYYRSTRELVETAAKLHGHLTATIHGTEDDLRSASSLISTLETKVGRLLFNGFPTGVEVCHSMVHGGPFPSTSDGRSTSVGTRAMLRLVRPVCYQDLPDELLPAALQRANPLGILRLINGELKRS